MRCSIVPVVVAFLAAAACAGEAPQAGAETADEQWGEPVDWLQCSLRTEKEVVPEGAEVVFELHLEFNKKEADRDIKFLNRYLDARRVTITFTNTVTGEKFERLPYDHTHGVPPDIVKEDIAVMHKPLAPTRLSVGLVSPQNSHVPPGTYSVAATYHNDAKPDVELYKGGDVLYDGPWRFWTGTITSSPLTLKVRRVNAAETRIKTNSSLEIRVALAGIGWAWSEDNPKMVRVKPRPGYVLGKRYELHIFVSSEEIRYGGYGLASSAWQDGDWVGSLPPDVTRRVKNGEALKLRADVEIFETSVKAGEGWKPTSGDFRALWKDRIEGELGEELRKTFSSISDAL